MDPESFDGAVLFTGLLSFASASGALRSFLSDLGTLPVVSLGVALDGVPSVAVDQGAAIAELVRHLAVDHGLQRFAFVGGPPEQIEAVLRRDAFRRAVAGLGIAPEQVEEFPGDYFRESGAAAIRALAPRWSGPLGLVCANDEEAVGALEECRKQGLSVPGQVAVVGFDDTELARLQEPSLTSVGQPFLWLAARALDLLVRRIAGESDLAPEVVPAMVCLRESCGCPPAAQPPAPANKAALLRDMLDTQTNATGAFQEFSQGWIADYLTAFEYLLETGNPSVLKAQWSRYYNRINVEQERGLPFWILFSGLEVLYSGHPAYDRAVRENLTLAGVSESRKRVIDDQATRNFFFSLHAVELAIGQVNDRASLAALPFSGLSAVGVLGVALVRFGAPPTLVYWNTATGGEPDPSALGPIAYPALLPSDLVPPDLRSRRIVVTLTAENTYLGYAVFWVGGTEDFVCDFLANLFADAVHRVELLEQVRDQGKALSQALEESKRMQDQLVETEKVAALGRLVAGVAHEINTPLGTGITGTSFLMDRLTELRTDFDAGTLSKSGLAQFIDQGREALEGVLRNLMRAGELVQAFKGLDLGQGEWKLVEVRPFFEDLVKVYAGALSKRTIGFRSEYPDAGVFIYSQPSALVQIVGELLENAMEHAFPADFQGTPQILFQVALENGAFRLAVTDNGRGLDADERRHLFDPLFTSKRPQGHSGLGLHLAFQLVNRTLGGRMSVASEPGAGSCFLCVIPLKPV